MKRIRVAAALAAIAAGTVIGGGPSAIADGGAKSRIEIKKLRASSTKGTVRSGRNPCESGRKVSLFLLDDFVSDKIAITKTNANGRWRVKKNLKPGLYFAKVDAAPGCRYDVSPSKRLR